MKQNKKEKGNFPILRFKEFQGECEEMKLGEVCRMQAGKFVSASEIFDNQNDDLLPCYGGNGLRGYTKSFNQDGIYSLIGRQGALCGNVTLANGKFHATEHAVVVTPEKNNDTIWMFYLLSSLNLNQYATGQAQPGLSVQNLEKIEILLPESKAEQIKIGVFLSLIDKRISTQSKIIEKYESLIKGISEKLLLQKVRFKEFTEKWVLIILEKVLIKNSIKNKNQKYSIVQSVSNKYGFINQDEIFEDRRVASLNTSNYYVIEKGCFAYNPSRINIGSLAYKKDNETSVISPLYVSFRANNNFLFDDYLWHWFQTINFTQQMNNSFEGSVRNTLNYENLVKMVISIPSTKEQIKIADFLSKISDKIENEKQILDKLKKQKKFLLSQMFI